MNVNEVIEKIEYEQMERESVCVWNTGVCIVVEQNINNNYNNSNSSSNGQMNTNNRKRKPKCHLDGEVEE